MLTRIVFFTDPGDKFTVHTENSIKSKIRVSNANVPEFYQFSMNFKKFDQ